jgi:hypothetical protein
LWREGLITRAFFVRFPLGGPHVRLRVEATGGEVRHRLQDLILRAADRFFDACPSYSPLSTEEIQRQHHIALSTTPGEVDDRIYPDNHLLPQPFVPETERYGGEALLGASLDLFSVSSLAVLDLIRSCGDGYAAASTTAGMRFLLQQALGVAESVVGLCRLASYPERLWRRVPEAVLRSAEDTYQRQEDLVVALIRHEVEDAVAAETPPPVQGGAALLSRILARRMPRGHEQIAVHHLHMSANRIGWTPPQEVYGMALLARGTTELLRQEPAWCARVGRALAARGEGLRSVPALEGQLAALIAEGFAALSAELPAGGDPP